MKSKFRSRLFVDRTVQSMLVKRVVLHWMAFFFLFTLTLFSIEYFLKDPGTTMGECLSSVASKHSLLFMLIVALLPVFIYDTIRMSHRFAGPISRLKKSLRSLALGENVEEVTFRSNDFWNELSEDFNRVAKRLNNPSNTPSQPSA
jgi:hypothetical protein